MPPKNRGRGGRGRGSGRGGATSSQPSTGASETLETAPPLQNTDATAAETSNATIVPKQEDDGDQPAPTDTSISATVEAQLAPSITTSSITSPQTGTESPARAPRQRLDSLKSTEPPSRSSSPSIRRGTSTRGKKSFLLPPNISRRAKEDRDARKQEAKDREKERNKERDELARKKQQAKEREEKRERDMAAKRRGGYSGAVSGPFATYSSRQDRRSAHRSAASYGGGSGSRATRVKNEHDDAAGPSQRSSGVSIKKEDGGYISSDDEQDAEFPRKDIDLIEISSDEDDAAPVERRERGHLPVRIGRKEHKERVVGINTEASTEVSAKILQHAETKGTALTAEALERPSHKGKGKTKDVEITGERRPYRGMWQDPEEPDVKVKPEPADSEDEMEDAVQVGIGATSDKAGRRADQSPEVERKPKVRGRAEPNLQTDEERAEWARYQSNLRHIRAELGPEEISTLEGSGDVSMVDAAASISKPSVRDDHVYLFQLPPIMPDLLPPGVKKEPSDAQHSTSDPPLGARGETVPIKKEEEFSSTLTQIPEGPRFSSGRVGKLRVHQSGRTTLDWGGTSYELTPGNQASFLQEVVSINVVPQKDRSAEEDAGEATSFGRVKGKFIVTPDFSQLFN